MDPADEEAVDALVASFYAAFDNRGGRVISIDRLRNMFLPGAVIVRSGAAGIETMTVGGRLR